MKRHLNTLFVTTDGAYLSKEGEAVSVSVDSEVRLRIPLLNLQGIVCFGRVSCSPWLMGAAAEAGVAVSFLTMTGRFLAAVHGFAPGNVLLRRAQYRLADEPAKHSRVVRNIIAAKIANCRSVALRGARDSKEPAVREELTKCSKDLIPPLKSVMSSEDVEFMRGLEGVAARTYFQHFNSLLKRETAFVMNGRTRRPPLDPVNALLSFLYNILAQDMRGACEATGLDAAVGFLHRDRPGRPGLALDLMEEFRPYFADRLAASLINRQQVKITDFVRDEAGGYRMSDQARKEVLTAYQKRKDDEIIHPFLKEKVTVGLLPHIQARLLARYIRGDLDQYPAFIWK